MSKAVNELPGTRCQRGMICTSVMHLKDRVTILKAMETLTSCDCSTVECLLKKVEALDAEFKQHHYTVIDHVGDSGQKFYVNQAVMDNHENKVAEITECLQQL